MDSGLDSSSEHRIGDINQARKALYKYLTPRSAVLTEKDVDMIENQFDNTIEDLRSQGTFKIVEEYVETEIMYVQVVPKGSDCYKEVKRVQGN